jgi:hypothetical protein
VESRQGTGGATGDTGESVAPERPVATENTVIHVVAAYVG